MNLAPPCLRINGKRVVIEYDPPPAHSTTRYFDYAATFDSYEPGDPIGRGATAVDAVKDLKEQDDE